VNETSVVIIGAGPAGLAAGAVLKSRGIEPVILEKEAFSGGAYAKLHPDLRFLSPQHLISLPLFEGQWTDELVSFGDYKNYLNDYRNQFKLDIRYQTSVAGVSRIPEGFELSIKPNTKLRCRYLIVATGLMSFPNNHPFSKEENPSVEFQMAYEWKGADYYKNKSVLVVGSGVSAMELASLLAGKTSVTLLMNRVVHTLPLKILGLNIHNFTRWSEKLPRALFYGICNGKIREPVLDFGIDKASKLGLIKLKVGSGTLKEGVAVFDDQSQTSIDVLLNCTGYRFDRDILPTSDKRRLNGNILTRKNQSLSDPNLFLMGYPCANKVDSVYLRGIKSDAFAVAEQITKSYFTK
jgi:hypothetical protein